MAGGLEGLLGGGGGIMPFARKNSDTLLQLGAGLLGGQNTQEQLAGGLNGVIQGRKQNRTIEFLRQQNPELAQAVESGALSGGDAYKLFYQQKLEAQKPVKPLEVNGRLVDPNSYEVLADFSTPPKPEEPKLVELYDNQTGYPYKAQYNPATGGYDRVGGLKTPREDAQTLTATDKKALWSAEDEIPVLDSTISSLNRAKELNDKTFTGAGAGARGYLGTAIPGGDYFVDGEKAKATSEFGKIMSMEAIQSMAQTLKGATTDRELAQFVEILADPSTPPEIRARTIDRMSQLAQRVKEVKVNRINELRGNSGGINRTNGGNRTSSGVNWSVEP